MGGIKPIETVYNGYKFRSRLEARWAVFFDKLAVEYEYEHQGYDLEEYGWYLPDFQLLGSNTFVEIKPKGNWFFDPKLDQLAQKSGECAIYVCGNPWPGEYKVCHYTPDGHCTGSDPLAFAWEEKAGKLWIAFEGDFGWYFSVQETTERGRLPALNHPVLDQAYVAARQARFEHGESGFRA